jgi:hypothetical protein
MIENKIIQDYVNNFRRRIAQRLKPDFGIKCNVFPAESGGAVLEFIFGLGIKNEDTYMNLFPSANNALASINQRAFEGDLGGLKFKGTNTILEADRIILIKDEALSEWDDNAAQRDINRIFHGHKGEIHE